MPTATTSALQQQVDWPAVDARRMLGALATQEGVTNPTQFAVTQRGAGANMSVDVSAGTALVADDHGSGGGFYPVAWTATENVVIATADPTNPRIDRIVLRVHDQALGDSDNVISIVAIAGTPTGGADLTNLNGAAAVPGSALLLANVLVPAAATTIVTADIQRVAQVIVTAGGLGLIYDTTLTGAVASVDVTGIPAAASHLLIAVNVRSTKAGGGSSQDSMILRFNNDSGGHYTDITVAGLGTGPDASSSSGATSMFAHYSLMPGSSAAANQFSGYLILVMRYANTATFKSCILLGGNPAAAAAAGSGYWADTSAINRVTLSAAGGNLDTGSRVTIYSLF